MEAALLGVLGGVIGLVIGKVWDRGDERRRWLRDARARAYVEYIERFQAVRQIVRRIGTLPRQSADWEAARRSRRDLWSAYNSALVQVELYGAPEVYGSVLQVDSELRRLSVVVSASDLAVDEWHRERVEMDSKMREVVDLVRAELRLQPHHDRSSWVLASPSESEPRLGP
ncbi:MAG: hypothetical protein ACRCYU_04760 [Nocardioides sp.]